MPDHLYYIKHNELTLNRTDRDSLPYPMRLQSLSQTSVVNQNIRTLRQSLSALSLIRSFFYSKTSASIPIYKMHGGLSIPVTDHIDVSPNYLIQYQNGLQFNLGGYAGYRLKNLTASNIGNCRMILGLWYRFKDAVIVSSGFEAARWNFGFSYDSNRSYLGRNLGNVNAYEVSLTYKMVKANNVQRFSSPLL